MDALILTLAATALCSAPAATVAVFSARRLFLAHGAMALAYGFVCFYSLAALLSLFGVVSAGSGRGLEPAGLALSLGSVPLWLAVRAMALVEVPPAPRRGGDPIFHSIRSDRKTGTLQP